MTERKNPDYSASAVMLTNSPNVASIYAHHQFLIQDLENLKAEADRCIPQTLRDRIALAQKAITENRQALEQAIDEYGSCQDVEKGEYAVKQLRESVIYKPELVRQYAPAKIASFVIVESVDTKAMEAMIKANQITAQVARRCGEIKQAYAYIIR